MSQPALIRMEMIGRLQHRDLVLRSVAAACKLVTPPADSNALQEFRMGGPYLNGAKLNKFRE